MPQIGRLERIDLRSIWRREDTDFTVWLAANIEYLSEVLGFELTVHKIEESVGPYRVDIYGADTFGNKVIIENQLEKTDHTHLGQLLTYLVNLEAKTAIWVSAAPVEEHRNVIEWLNEITPEDVNFYLVRVEGLRMRGEETVAPLFTLVEGPSVERKKIGNEKKEYAEQNKLRHEFWSRLIASLNERGTLAQNVSADGKDKWLGLALGMSGTSINLNVSRDGARSEVYLNRGDATKNKALFDYLFEMKDTLEASLGLTLEWARMDDQVTSRIKIEKKGLNVNNRDDWEAMILFLVDTGIRLHQTFKEPIRLYRLTQNA